MEINYMWHTSLLNRLNDRQDFDRECERILLCICRNTDRKGVFLFLCFNWSNINLEQPREELRLQMSCSGCESADNDIQMTGNHGVAG